MTKKLFVPLIALALASFLLVACGDDDSTSSDTVASETSSAGATSTPASGGATVSFEAESEGLAYTETDVSAPAGSDTIAFDNPSSTSHNVVIEDADGNDVAETDTIAADTTDTTADLEPGTYTFYCSVDGHRDAGMEGTLTVK